MANYYELSVPELEQKRDSFVKQMMASNDEAEIELLSNAIEAIEDIIDERDPLAEE